MLEVHLWLKLAFANVVNFINKTDSDFSKRGNPNRVVRLLHPDANILQEAFPLINLLPKSKTIGVSNPSFPIHM